MQNIIRILIMQALNLLFDLLRRITKKPIYYYRKFYEMDKYLRIETLHALLITRIPSSILHYLINIPLLDDKFTGINSEQDHK